jgi:hypothetical protein
MKLPILTENDTSSLKQVLKIFSNIYMLKDNDSSLNGISYFDKDFSISAEEFLTAYRVVYRLTESYDSITMKERGR